MWILFVRRRNQCLQIGLRRREKPSILESQFILMASLLELFIIVNNEQKQGLVCSKV